MKALAIDSAVTRLTIAAKNDDKVCCAVYDIGMKQSETLVNAIDYVLSKVDLTTSDLDYSAVCAGPGSFTGLRLGYAALKAIELTNGKPIYAIPSLKAYSFAYEDLGLPVLSTIDAKKDRIYANISNKGTTLLEDGDYEISNVVSEANKFEKLILCGPDTPAVKQILIENNVQCELLCPKVQSISAEGMFAIAEKMISDNIPSMEDYDGPVYLRASEAEIKLSETQK